MEAGPPGYTDTVTDPTMHGGAEAAGDIMISFQLI